MRLTYGIAFFLAALLFGCSGNSALYMDIGWQVRCQPGSSVSGSCNYPDHAVKTHDNENNFQVTCRLENRDKSNFALYFSVFVPGDYGIEITNAVFPKRGGAVQSSGCGLRIVEDYSYEGSCGSDDAVPCKFSSVTVDGKGTVSGTFSCSGLFSPTAGMGGGSRLVTSPVVSADPAYYRIENCEQL